MDAIEIINRKQVVTTASLTQAVVWLVPEPLKGSLHRYKYRLNFGRRGEQLVGYDNERGKGDHRHLGGHELPYDFRDIETLIADFRRTEMNG